jgi:hypothetical protein
VRPTKLVVVRIALATLLTGLAIPGMAGVANAADNAPCGPSWWHAGQQSYVQTCPDWAPDNSIPVYVQPEAGARVQGYIYAPGDDWYFCQVKAGRLDRFGYFNTWWAATVADNGEHGWVSQIYFSGGGNDERDAGLRNCFS